MKFGKILFPPQNILTWNNVCSCDQASIIIHGDTEKDNNYISNLQDHFHHHSRHGKKTADRKAEDNGGVTIVQNHSQSTVSDGESSTVVVTVSATVDAQTSPRSTPEVEILAHL